MDVRGRHIERGHDHVGRIQLHRHAQDSLTDDSTQKMGVKEPQVEPMVATQDYTTTGVDALPCDVDPVDERWRSRILPTIMGTIQIQPDGTAPIVITGGGPFLVPGSTVTLTVTGSATVNGATHALGDAGPTSAGYTGSVSSPERRSFVRTALTDSAGNHLFPRADCFPSWFLLAQARGHGAAGNATQLRSRLVELPLATRSPRTVGAVCGRLVCHCRVQSQPFFQR